MSTAPQSPQARRKREAKPSDDGIVRMAHCLNAAWAKYTWLFGIPPRGTSKQIAAMLELCPQAKEAIRLFEKQREEGMTR